MSASSIKKTEGSLHIAVGSSRYEKNWKNGSASWDQLAEKLKTSQATGETHAEYMAKDKASQDRIKDIGGFVGGWLKDGRRSAQTVLDRTVLTLDADSIKDGKAFIAAVEGLYGLNNAVIYSTHKHTPERPRLRLIMELSRPVKPEEYEAIARKVADRIGMEYFDPTSFRPSQLMYWPSHPKDVKPYYMQYFGDPLDADAILADYPDWTDVSFWPIGQSEEEIRRRSQKKQSDPLEKGGVVGVFCRAYSIPDAIATFLSDVYEPGTGGRYTYIKGSSHNGLVVYEDGRFAYSNHSTDPACGQLCNSFDLVRIHKFGALDENSEPTGAFSASYKAMCDFAVEQDEYKKEYFAEKQKAAADEFAEPVEAAETADSWKTKLSLNKNGQMNRLMENLSLIMENDPGLKGTVGYNELNGVITVRKPLPWNNDVQRTWSDADDVQLFSYIEKRYGQMPKQLVCDSVVKAADDHKFNPIKTYLKQFTWDGVPRVDTLLIDYLGAEDTPYTRAVTRNTLTAAVRRIYEPGVKFDYMPVLVGKTGIGKSTLWSKLGGDWFSDSLALDDMRDKTAAEKLQGFWILEIGEMQGARRADVNNVKSFLSRQSDNYRAAYGRYVIEHPRSCIIVGTTNELDGFLKDLTGNRRFWPVECFGDHAASVWDLTDDIVGQIWAEAVEINKQHAPLNLPEEIEKVAAEKQREMLESDDRMGMVQDYLETLLPAGWYDWPLDLRVDYFQQHDETMEEGIMKRERVCAMEIWMECLGGRKNSYDSYRDGRTIGAIMAKMPGWAREDNSRYIKGYGTVKCWAYQGSH